MLATVRILAKHELPSILSQGAMNLDRFSILFSWPAFIIRECKNKGECLYLRYRLPEFCFLFVNSNSLLTNTSDSLCVWSDQKQKILVYQKRLSNFFWKTPYEWLTVSSVSKWPIEKNGKALSMVALGLSIVADFNIFSIIVWKL